jgi:hypothetical protein
MMLATTKDNASNRRAAPDLSHPIFEVTKRLRSAAKTGRRLHLEPEHVQLLLGEEIYSVMSAIEAKEMRSACRAATANDNATSSVTSGCGSGPTVELGPSAGSNVIPMDAASRGASLLLREEAELMRRRKKH